jgi:FMN phosphatase YigB (HAD superfamily)
MFPVVAALQAAGYRTGILSNTCKCHWDYCIDGRFGMIPGAFEQLVLSFHARSMKPQPRIYEVAIERAGVGAAEIFFIDDRPENVAAAEAAGMDAVLYRDASDCADQLRRRGARFNY